MGVSENRGPYYSTPNSRILIIRTPEYGTPSFRTLPLEGVETSRPQANERKTQDTETVRYTCRRQLPYYTNNKEPPKPYSNY